MPIPCVPHHIRSIALPLLALLALQGCTRRCGLNDLTIGHGTVVDAGGLALAVGGMTLRQESNPGIHSLYASLQLPANTTEATLVGHLRRVQWVTEAGEPLSELTTSDGTIGGFIIAIRSLELTQAQFEVLRSALLTTRTKIVVDTDLPGREHLESVIREVVHTEPVPPVCHGT